MTCREEIAKRLPKAIERAKTSRLTAIRLFCIECMGGSSREAKACTQRDCFLWPVRGSSWRQSR
jgi:hypothetical protein